MSLTGIYKRKDGRWEARLRLDNNDNGKSIIKSFYGKTVIDVQKKMYTYKRSVLYDEKTEKPFFDLCYEWLEIMQNRVKPSTFANYLTKIEKHIIPAFNEKLCRQITRREVYEFMRIKLNEGLSSRYVSDIMVLFKSIFKYAQMEYGIDYILEGIVMPKSPPVQVRILNKSQQETLKSYIDDNTKDLCGLGALLALTLGLRLGEVCGLQWKDIDLQKRVLTIRRTVQRVAVGGEKQRTSLLLMPPKSDSSIREIPLPDHICRSLINKVKDPEIFVLNEKSTPLEPRTLQYRFAAILECAGLPPVTFHSLRHTFATNAIELGFDVKTLSEILGHSKVEITLNKYVHSSIDRKRACMDLLN